MKSTGAIITSGSSTYIRGFENMKFKQKDFKNKLFSDPEFANAFNMVARNELESLLVIPPENLMVDQSSQNIINNILGL